MINKKALICILSPFAFLGLFGAAFTVFSGLIAVHIFLKISLIAVGIIVFLVSAVILAEHEEIDREEFRQEAMRIAARLPRLR